MNILITGGAGFIGSNLAEYYLKKNHQVTIFDSLTKEEGAYNIVRLKKLFGSQLVFMTQDIRNFDAVQEVVKDQDIIFHLAGHTVSKTAISHPRFDFEVNSFGTLNLLEAIRTKNPKAIVMYASSAKIYGNLKGYKKTHFSEIQPVDPISPISSSIATADQYVHDFGRSYGLKTVVFRLSDVYGEHQFGTESDDWISYAIKQSHSMKPVDIFGEQSKIIDPLYIKDVIAAFDQAWTRIDTASTEIFNLGGGQKNAVTIQKVIQILESIMAKRVDLVQKPARLNDQQYYVSNNAKALKILDWKPKTSIEDGIQNTYNWLTKHLDTNTV